MRWAILILILCASFFLWGDNFGSKDQITISKTFQTKFGDSAVSLAFDEVLIVESESKNICFIQFKSISEGNIIHYVTKFLPKNSTHKQLGMITEESGTVFEKYWRTRTGLNSYFVFDIGGDGKIECGEMSFNWSSATWVYHHNRGRIAVAKDLNFGNENINNYSIKWQP